VLDIPPSVIKQGMRERIRAERRRRGPAHREAAAVALADVALEIPEIVRAGTVAAYVSTPSAPGTLPLRRALRANGIRVLLPVLLGDGHLDWAEDGDDGSSLHDQHVAPPSEHLLGLEAVGQAQAVIVPALAVDTLGNRLGQGGGFYDRTLRMLDPTVPVFAIVYDGEVLDAAIEPVPAERHDQQVDAIVTPHRCLRLLPDRRR
jgi:5-formyltetrahydrofolate cyclo-ligase